jgi:hypothetical protein
MNIFIKKILDEPIINNPWPHQIVSDLLDTSLFNEVDQQCQKLLLLKQKSLIYPNDFEKYNLDLKDKVDSLSTDILFNFEPIIKQYPYHRRYSQKPEIDTHISVVRPLPYKHVIHDESADKILSIILYVTPTLNKGTLMYNENDEKTLIKTVPWKQNSAFIFCGRDQSTWHSFESDETNNRVTLNFFIKRQR